ncbi:hypothetical protein [Holdemania massiliensis]|uniref:Ankyrin repeat domain-containing protein n=1 Tax=Holdemania massiliensis TaxID=1468449 RepID=A0A6N7S2J1_9FIRM|nr:hypothetical protein [Holdemania massiliensis]MSA69537.1 ankyrin repeat domain-containing protein [Holdemania massiliensis]MSA87748.1 ankyrin repeat domain-containing protein [Holdemania massiliensis]MSB76618.1 ankyrin repeat domain-containing protein [Holdemania massiliensis]MSC31543.1 ankyrin repeat domain-containing protein [Holdemania massiliensis]MSC39463.1 ankyrin repeat domain-containing protein [Holdemania massiliensis]
MNIKLVAKLKGKEEFIKNYSSQYIVENDKMESILFYSISNNNLEARYYITNFLLDEGTNPIVINEEHETLLHVLLSQVKHDLNKTINLCQRLIDAGVDVNVLDNKCRLALQYLINLKYTDLELEPLYNYWFNRKGVDVEQKNDWGMSPIDIARKLPYRKDLVKRIEQYKLLNE